MKVLVCGGRDFANVVLLEETLNALHAVLGFTVLIHGDARGADRMAGRWAHKHGIQEVICRANWDFHGNKAGPLRNRAMLKLDPSIVVAFPGGTGTNDMIAAARMAGVRTHLVEAR